MMKLLVLVCCVAFASVGSSPISSPRIIGGGATPGEHYTVSVQYSGNHICGGALLTPSDKTEAPQGKKFILTAAHCVHGLDKTNLKVLVGTNTLSEPKAESTRKLAQVTNVTPHPDFDIFDLLNDIAVLEVDAIKDENAPLKTVVIEANDPAKKYEFSGWGRLASKEVPDALQTLVPIDLESTCGDNQLCVLGTTAKGACVGDAGGPLIEVNKEADGTFTPTNKLIGILSYGYGCATAKPYVFTNVKDHETFIKGVIEKKEGTK